MIKGFQSSMLILSLPLAVGCAQAVGDNTGGETSALWGVEEDSTMLQAPADFQMAVETPRDEFVNPHLHLGLPDAEPDDEMPAPGPDTTEPSEDSPEDILRERVVGEWIPTFSDGDTSKVSFLEDGTYQMVNDTGASEIEVVYGHYEVQEEALILEEHNQETGVIHGVESTYLRFGPHMLWGAFLPLNPKPDGIAGQWLRKHREYVVSGEGEDVALIRNEELNLYDDGTYMLTVRSYDRDGKETVETFGGDWYQSAQNELHLSDFPGWTSYLQVVPGEGIGDFMMSR